MSATPNLALPYIAAAQAQKHVTHNEAIRALDAIVHLAVIDRDVVTPPSSPSDGDRYLIPSGAMGSWADHDLKIAAFQDGAWQIYTPQSGWRAWIISENTAIFYNGTTWEPVEGNGVLSVNPVSLVGVNTTADATNKLSVKSDAVLFSHDDVTPGTGDVRQVLNKASADNTVSQLYQSNWSGRAETGLTGDDDFRVKVSADGGTWHDAIVIDKATGAVTFPNTTLSGGGGGTPGGSPTQVQYNSGGSFEGSANLTFDETTGILSSAGLKLADASAADGAGTISLGPVRFAHSYGTDNTFLGRNAGNFTLTIGSAVRNTAIGDGAMESLTTGSGNMAFGTDALGRLTTGKENSAIGNFSMRLAATTTNTVAIGAGAFFNMTAGDLNVGIGRFVGQQLTTGSQNILIGYVAGGGIETGFGNVVIGGVTGLSPTLSNHVILATGPGVVRLTIDGNGHAAFEGAVRPNAHSGAIRPAIPI